MQVRSLCPDFLVNGLTGFFRSHHIKCDEEKPRCLRCARSGRTCEGYSHTLTAEYPETTNAMGHAGSRQLSDRHCWSQPIPGRSLRTECFESLEQLHFVQLGLELLVSDSFSAYGASAAVLQNLLPQLCFTVPSVCAAAAALGSVSDTRTSENNKPLHEKAHMTTNYQLALKRLRRDLSLQPQGAVPLILICLMLSMVEVMSEREEDALFHLAGASTLLLHRGNEYDSLHSAALGLEDGIQILCRTVDLQTSSYALGKPPELLPVAIPAALPDIVNLGSAHNILVQVAHSCYHFAQRVLGINYQSHPINVPILEQQSRLIAHLHTWLEHFEVHVLPALSTGLANPATTKSGSHALALRVTALSALTHISCALSPFESSYDAHEHHFQQIIADGVAIMSARHIESPSRRNGQRFTVGPGMIEPLFQTACKYRNPIHRPRALRLLSLAGREGPWDGRREAAVTSRIMALEEQDLGSTLLGQSSEGSNGHTSTTTQTNPPDGEHNAWKAGICEALRVNQIGIKSLPADDGSLNKVAVRFFRCRDMQQTLSFQCRHGDGENTHPQGCCSENPYWETWTEILDY